MNSLTASIWIELRKVSRSKMPWLTAIGILFLPLAGALFIFIFKDPEFARSIGLLSAKANLRGGTADWPTFLSILLQGTAIAGGLFFGLIDSWVFGREFSDGTLKDMLAVPVSRTAILLAKFFVVTLWSLALVLLVYLVSLGIGALLALPPVPASFLLSSGLKMLVTGLMVILVLTPVVLFASIGRGYLLPMGVSLVIMMLAQVAAALGWGSLVPWSIPALYAGMISGPNGDLVPASYVIVLVTGLLGIDATIHWWNRADQSR